MAEITDLTTEKSRLKSNESAPERVYEQIREAIRQGQFIPGSRLRERDVASQFNVSRTPVREALRRLESEGILTSSSQKGLKVTELDHQMIAELYYMRELLEGTAAGLAAVNATQAEVQLMRMIVSEEKEYIENAADLARLNYALHQTIQGAARNRYLVVSLNTLRDGLMLIPSTNLGDTRRAEASHQEHLKIVAAIEARDADAAIAAARAHISSAYASKLMERTTGKSRHA
ncbi:transcriptional regulator, GntR family [Rhizobium sp. CF080]|uniref:GntR family transcriptional regulator n=1 Tax=Rhizobium sp. (strain CF080) TaxID=1144310 RepID=UPI00027188B3|nr:GntR family transcriptional regulator [Rhizobium sp. CF080]EUB99301.1 transcriptional regulator, GntR family [Rhizobium sp. CF080]